MRLRRSCLSSFYEIEIRQLLRTFPLYFILLFCSYENRDILPNSNSISTFGSWDLAYKEYGFRYYVKILQEVQWCMLIIKFSEQSQWSKKAIFLPPPQLLIISLHHNYLLAATTPSSVVCLISWSQTHNFATVLFPCSVMVSNCRKVHQAFFQFITK